MLHTIEYIYQLDNSHSTNESKHNVFDLEIWPHVTCTIIDIYLTKIKYNDIILVAI